MLSVCMDVCLGDYQLPVALIVIILGIGPREGLLLGANLGRGIVTNGDFTA